MANTTQGRIVVRVPDADKLTREELKRPFILHYLAPQGTQVTGVVQVPNMLDLIGVPSGGGPPGFVTFEPDLKKKDVLLPWPKLIVAYTPGSKVELPEFATISHLGSVVTSGIILSYHEVLFHTTHKVHDADTQEKLSATLKEAGFVPLPLVEYETPPHILNGRLEDLPTPGRPQPTGEGPDEGKGGAPPNQ